MSPQFGAEFTSLDEAFLATINVLLRQGRISAPRDLPTLEVVPFAFSITDPRRRYVSVPERRWSIAYAIAELVWHLRGSGVVDEIAFYAQRWRKIAHGRDAITGSCYGSRVFKAAPGRPSQWETALALLRKDPATRRAVLYFPAPDADPLDPSADIACALSLQFILRGGRLDAICTMRSNDAMLGMPYDVFLFTMMQEMAAVKLGSELGSYHHQMASVHLYESQVALAERVVASKFEMFEPMTSMSSLDRLDVLLQGEADSRLGVALEECSPRSAGYWDNLLDVILRWADSRHNATDASLKPALRDPVLEMLFGQWWSTRKLPAG